MGFSFLYPFCGAADLVMLEFWTFLPLFNMFQCFQDASAWVTEGFALKV